MSISPEKLVEKLEKLAQMQNRMQMMKQYVLVQGPSSLVTRTASFTDWSAAAISPEGFYDPAFLPGPTPLVQDLQDCIDEMMATL